MNPIGGNMLLVKSSWNDGETFRMLPVTEDCPYVECIFDPGTKVFVIISKTTKQSLHMLPKLDDYGQVITGTKGTKQDRHKIEVFQEFYIENAEAITEIVEHFAINAKKFNYKSFMAEEKKSK